MNQMIFDFSLQDEKRKNWLRIFYAKGGYYGVFLVWSLVILIGGFFFMPWGKAPKELIFRGFIIMWTFLIIYHYYKTIIKISIDNDSIGIVVWKKEQRFSLKDIKEITLTYYFLYGGATMRIKGKRNRFFIIWAPTFDERYKLYCSLKTHLKERNLLSNAKRNTCNG